MLLRMESIRTLIRVFQIFRLALMQLLLQLMNGTAYFSYAKLIILSLCLSLHGREESSFWDLAPPDDMVDSKYVVGAKPADISMVIGCQVGNLFAPGQECLVAWLQTCTGFMCKASTLAIFPLEQHFENYCQLSWASVTTPPCSCGIAVVVVIVVVIGVVC